jgi:hypothetical protein
MRGSGLLALFFAVSLSGCLAIGPSPETRATWDRTPGLGEQGMTKEQKTAKDDGICRSYGAQPGTPAYIQCRATQDQRRDAVMLSETSAPPPVIANNNAGVPPSDAPVLRNILPPQTRCQSMRVGMAVQTVCN